MKKAVIWRESVYKNDFRCNVCKEKLSNNGVPSEEILSDEEGRVLYCPTCRNCVAYVKDIEIDLPSGLYGNWKEFCDGQSL